MVAVAQIVQLVAGPSQRLLRLAMLALALGDLRLQLGDLGLQLPGFANPREHPGLGAVAAAPQYTIRRQHVARSGGKGAGQATRAVDPQDLVQALDQVRSAEQGPGNSFVALLGPHRLQERPAEGHEALGYLLRRRREHEDPSPRPRTPKGPQRGESTSGSVHHQRFGPLGEHGLDRPLGVGLHFEHVPDQAAEPVRSLRLLTEAEQVPGSLGQILPAGQ